MGVIEPNYKIMITSKEQVPLENRNKNYEWAIWAQTSGVV